MEGEAGLPTVDGCTAVTIVFLPVTFGGHPSPTIVGMTVLSLYEGFFSGGARILHTAVVRALHATTGHEHRVLSLSNRVTREFTSQPIDADTGHRRLVAAGIEVAALDRDGGDGASYTPLQLAAVERAIGGAEIVLSLKEQPLEAVRRTGTAGRPLVATLHRSDPEHSGPALEALADLHEQGLLTAATCCARSTQRAYHAATGIPLDLLPVIPNGVDLWRFRPDAYRRRQVRERLGIAPHAPVVLLAARFDEMKDVPLFVRTARRFVAERHDAHLVLCGAGMSADNPELTSLLTTELGHWDGLAAQVHLAGIQPEMAPWFAATDLVVLTSAFGEAAPLSLMEGMACGAVPVTTDVGDAALIVGDPRLVGAHDPDALGTAWLAAYDGREEHRERIARHRQRLSEQHCFDAYSALIDSLVPQRLVSVA